jgi:hypothetical protein
VFIDASVADRKPKPKKRGSRIGFIVDPFRRRAVWFESRLEEDWATVLIARPDVKAIREQQVVSYSDGPVTRRHFFDYVVTWLDGSRTAYAVKYTADSDRQGLRRVLELVAAGNGDAFADEYGILTEKGIDEVSIRNGRYVIECSADFDEEGRGLVRSTLAHCAARISLADIGSVTGLGTRGRRAAVSLIQDGCLEVAPGESLGPKTVLENHLSAGPSVNPILTAAS